MDNILFVPSTRELEWVQDALPGTSPAELPVAGRRLIDYSLESAWKSDVLLTEVLDWRFSQRLEDSFGDLTRTGHPVFYVKGEGSVPKGLADIGNGSGPLSSSVADGLVVVWGAGIAMNLSDDLSLEPMTEAECAETAAGVYRRENGRWMRVRAQARFARSVQDWHELNFFVLRESDRFTLPGYSSENGVHLGRNVILEHGTDVKPPVLMLDNTWCARNVRLEGDVIVNTGSFIGEGARLRRTVVCADTFVGDGLDLDGKIVVGRRVIDAASGSWVDVEEPGLARKASAGLGWVRSLWRFFCGRSFGRRG